MADYVFHVPTDSLVELRLVVPIREAVKASARVSTGGEVFAGFDDDDLVRGARFAVPPLGAEAQVLIAFLEEPAQATVIAVLTRPDGFAEPIAEEHVSGSVGRVSRVSLRFHPTEQEVTRRLRGRERRTRSGTSRSEPVPATRGDGPRTAPQERPSPPGRYANVVLFERSGGDRLGAGQPIVPGQVLAVRINIGDRSPDSHVTDPEPLPDLPTEIWIDVLLSSTDFQVIASPDSRTAGDVARDRLLIPPGGGASRTPRGEPFLWFYLRAPTEPGLARARIGYYYNNALVQSQLFVAAIGGRLLDHFIEREGCFDVTTDYTATANFLKLEAVRRRPRLSLLANSNGGALHQVVVRSGDERGEPLGEPQTFVLDGAAVGGVLSDLREALRLRAPVRRKRSRTELQEDLLRLAPPANLLYNATIGALRDTDGLLAAARRDPDAFVLQVSRPSTSAFTLPWTLLYDILLERDAVKRGLRSGGLSLCPLVNEWDGRSPLVTGPARTCPHSTDIDHRVNLLCPFGFWGFRHSVEQLASTNEITTTLDLPPRFRFVAAETQYEVNKKDLAKHIAVLRRHLDRTFPGASLHEGKDKRTIQQLLGHDLPFVYFYCHGERADDREADTFLGVGERESIAATDFIGWVNNWRIFDERTVWSGLRPLVFVNACHSAEISPDTLIGYLDAFITKANAAGVIGTEVKVSQPLAMNFAEDFFDGFLTGTSSIDSVLHGIRHAYLADGNLFGLVYTAYCWADLTVRAVRGDG